MGIKRLFAGVTSTFNINTSSLVLGGSNYTWTDSVAFTSNPSVSYVITPYVLGTPGLSQALTATIPAPSAISSVTAYNAGVGMFDVNPETATKKSSSSKKAYSYVSMVNGKIEIDHDWDTCKKRVHGESNARYKKVVSAEEERSLIAEWKALGLSDTR